MTYSSPTIIMYVIWSISTIIIITNVTQNNTGMYTKESSRQTFKKTNNNLDGRFEWAYQNHNDEIEISK